MSLLRCPDAPAVQGSSAGAVPLRPIQEPGSASSGLLLCLPKRASRRRCPARWFPCSNGQRGAGCWSCPIAAVLAIPGRLLLLCFLLGSSWLTMTAAAGSRRQGAAPPGRTAALAEPVGVAGGAPTGERHVFSRGLPRCRARPAVWAPSVRCLVLVLSGSRPAVQSHFRSDRSGVCWLDRPRLTRPVGRAGEAAV